MTQNEKDCYNSYLATTRSIQNKPFNLRKDFSGFEDSPDYIYVKRIANFFTKFPHVIKTWYFQAPYKIYEDQKYFDLKFYASQKALKTYTLYMKQKREQSPDHNDMVDFIKESMKNIGSYCVRQKIPLQQYIYYKEGATYCWLKHLKEYKICIYPLFEWADFPTLVGKLPEDEKDLFLSGIAEHILTYKTRLANSQKAKHIIKEGIKRVKNVTG